MNKRSAADVTREFIRSRVIEDARGCWNWSGPKNDRGYGIVHFDRKKIKAHRMAFELWSGSPIPPGLFACHRCDNPACVNPSHIFIGTPKDNTLDMVAKGRAKGGRFGNKKGGDARGATVTNLQAKAIRNDPRSTRVIAEEHGVHHGTIWKIKTGRSYKEAA